MYLPTALNNNARLTPLSEDSRKLGFISRAMSILQSRSRQMTRQLAKEEEQAQRELFMRKLQESNQTIGFQSFQGLTGGYILHEKR